MYHLCVVYLSVVIDHTTYRFRVDNRYLFISRKNTTDNKKADQHSRRLYVSNNYDTESSTVGFTEVQLPSLQDQQVGIGTSVCTLNPLLLHSTVDVRYVVPQMTCTLYMHMLP